MEITIFLGRFVVACAGTNILNELCEPCIYFTEVIFSMNFLRLKVSISGFTELKFDTNMEVF